MTEAEDAPRVVNHRCAAPDCGQLDDHPMIHCSGAYQQDASTVVLNPSFHFDCLPPEFEMLLYGENGKPAPQHVNTIKAREAALAGTHGDDLVAHIAELAAEHNDNEVEPEGHYVTPALEAAGIVPESNVEA